jgi:hypothetical protein
MAMTSPQQPPKVTCDQVIRACDKALAAKDKEIALDKQTLDQSRATSQDTKKQLDEADKKLNSPARNPFILAGLGILGGIISPIGGVVVLTGAILLTK